MVDNEEHQNEVIDLNEEEVRIKTEQEDKKHPKDSFEEIGKIDDKSLMERLSLYFQTASSYSKRILSILFLITSMLFTGVLIIELYTKNFSLLWSNKPAKLIVLAITTTIPVYSINILLLTTLNAFKNTLFSKEEISGLKVDLTKNIFSGTLFSFTLILILLNYDFFSYKILFGDRTLHITDFIRHILILEVTVFLGMFYEKIRKKYFLYGLVIISTLLILLLDILFTLRIGYRV
ncbi:hypothetical protein U472_06170 [Orenia metallireducens]|uniref:Yip1 domain-containing protein n=1 Tax=Orenia metallireducens TaxID=1413210 RepID=A0A1C0A9V8_9FIRM|nr:hypothetical protein [Orenia metallireducens]OCL27065.1 hypothetical protein U472_06170 [Orenia metallireducens]